MSEFLQNLRAKQNKRYDGNRRQYPNAQYQDRRNDKDNRKQQQVVATAVETLSASLAENLPVIKTILEGISENQKRLAEAEDRRARAEERKASVLESIFDYAKQYIGTGINLSAMDPIKSEPENQQPTEQFPKEAGVESESPIESEITQTTFPSRKEVLALIGDMREKGATYDQIAKHLETEGIPTFSRKGQWRGQTVHRLYQKMTS